MIRLQCVGLYASDFSGGGTRLGDAQILSCGSVHLVIDGYCEKGADRLISVLKERNIVRLYVAVSHPHYDHYEGIKRIIRDPYFTVIKLFVPNPESYGDVSGEVRSNKQALRNIVAEAKNKDIPVSYLRNEQNVKLGGIRFTVYQDTTCRFDGNSEGYVNDRSLAFWFYELSYLTTGDAGMWAVQAYNLKPKWIKCGHHGNNIGTNSIKPSQMAPRLKKNGCLYYWDNDYSTKLTDFLMTGREDAQNAGMIILGIHGDINAVFFSKRAVIYKDGNIYRYACSYTGKANLKSADLSIVKTVLAGKAGAGDARISYLLNKGYNSGAVQKEVTEIVKLIKG